MAKRVIKIKSRFYIYLLSIMGLIGMISFSSCKGAEESVNTDTNVNSTMDTTVVTPAVTKYGTYPVHTQPTTKYGVPMNTKPIENPQTRYGVPSNLY